MTEQHLTGIVLGGVGVALLATRRGAHAWYANSARMGGANGPTAWLAEVLGPGGVNGLHGFLGLVALGAGLWALLSPL